MKFKVEGTFRSDKVMLSKLYDEEDQEIVAVEKVIKGDLDNTRSELIKKTMSIDHAHLKKLEHMI